MLRIKETSETPDHKHGGNPTLDFERLGITPGPVRDFSVNISPLGPPPAVLASWPDWTRDIVDYPSIRGAGVYGFYKRQFSLPDTAVLPGNGSIEMIYLVPRALGFRRVAVPTPSFHDYRRSAEVASAEVITVPLPLEADSPAAINNTIESVLPRVDAMFICNPNNPTGSLYTCDQIHGWAKAYPQTYFLVDEAFIQFVDRPERHSLLNPDYLLPNVIVFHSLTKFYALAGIRLGVAAGHPETIARLREKKEPWSVSRIAERVAEQLTDCEAYEHELIDLVNRERKRLLGHLTDLPCIRLYSSVANFFLAQWLGSDDLDDLLGELLRRRIYIRDCRNFIGLEKNFFRFAILGSEDNTAFIQAFQDIAKTYGSVQPS